MKLIQLTIAAIAAILLATACGSNKPDPQETLNAFLTSARKFDFKAASAYIEENSKAEFMELATFYDQIPDSVKNSLPPIPVPTLETFKMDDSIATIVAKTVISAEDAAKMGGQAETQIDTFRLKYVGDSWRIIMR